MSRKISKGPYVSPDMQRNLERLRKGMESGQISSSAVMTWKTWSRSCLIVPQMVGHKCLVHNGRKHIEVKIMQEMVGERLGSFSLTRTFKGHSGKKSSSKVQTGKSHV